MTSTLLTIVVLSLLRMLRLTNATFFEITLEHSWETRRGAHPAMSRRGGFFLAKPDLA